MRRSGADTGVRCNRAYEFDGVSVCLRCRRAAAELKRVRADEAECRQYTKSQRPYFDDLAFQARLARAGPQRTASEVLAARKRLLRAWEERR
jgi:hypothetical protein